MRFSSGLMAAMLVLVPATIRPAEPVAGATSRTCAAAPGQTCFTVRGRLWITNGGPWRRLWVVGTKRILGVHDDHELPENVEEALGSTADEPFGKYVFGDFTFCPFKADKAGVMRIGCIQNGVNLRAE